MLELLRCIRELGDKAPVPASPTPSVRSVFSVAQCFSWLHGNKV